MKHIPYTKYPIVFKNKDFWYNWCCDCGLRHIYFFDIIRGKTPTEDRVEVYIDRDAYATDARKRVKRNKKKIKALENK